MKGTGDLMVNITSEEKATTPVCSGGHHQCPLPMNSKQGRKAAQ